METEVFALLHFVLEKIYGIFMIIFLGVWELFIIVVYPG
jgi:hypothetical protein